MIANKVAARNDVAAFERLARFGLDNDIPIVHDSAYSELTFDGHVAGSFLAAPGAREAGVEMFSLSKSWNMTGAVATDAGGLKILLSGQQQAGVQWTPFLGEVPAGG